MHSHVSRATDALVAAAASEALDRMPFGCILVDRHGRVLLSNEEARRIVLESDAIRLTGGRLRAGFASRDGSLQRLIHAAIRNPSGGVAAVILRGGDERARIQVLISPLTGTDGPAVAVFVSHPHGRSAPSVEMLRVCFGFSPAEVRVVCELLAGRRMKEISAELSLTENTVRAYLKAMLAKTGCRSQAALVALVLRSVAVIRPPG